MARFLFAPIPYTGHVSPGIPIAEELVRRGHEVRWYTTARFKSSVERIGAIFVPMNRATELDEALLDMQFPDRGGLKGLDQLRYDIKHVFIDQIPAMLEDLTEEHRQFPADVVVGDNLSGVCGMLSERFNIPWTAYGVSVVGFPSLDAPPFGLGIIPGRSPFEKVRNRFLNWTVDHVVFKDPIAHFHRVRGQIGFSRTPETLFTYVRKASLYLQCGVEPFEYPRSDLPDTFRFIGTFTPAPPPDWTEPSWWSRLDAGKPVVLVTQGTIANDYDELIRPAIRALGDEDLTVIVTTGSKAAESVGISPVPANTIVEQFVPYAHLMPKVDLLLTNGGYGSIQIALSHGVPVLAFGASEDKPEIANRVTWSGVGLGVKSKTPSEGEILQAVWKILKNPGFKAKVGEMRKALRACDAAKTSGDLLEGLLR